MTDASAYDTTNVSPVTDKGVMHVGLAFVGRVMVVWREYEISSFVGRDCSYDDNDELLTLPLADGTGADILQILTVPSAAPEARVIVSSILVDGRTHTLHIASVWPTSVACGSTFLFCQILTVASTPPENIQLSCSTERPPEIAAAAEEARQVTIPA